MIPISYNRRPKSERTQAPRYKSYYILETDSIGHKAYYFPICKYTVAIEWALDTLHAMRAAHHAPQEATLYFQPMAGQPRLKIKHFYNRNIASLCKKYGTQKKIGD